MTEHDQEKDTGQDSDKGKFALTHKAFVNRYEDLSDLQKIHVPIIYRQINTVEKEAGLTWISYAWSILLGFASTVGMCLVDKYYGKKPTDPTPWLFWLLFSVAIAACAAFFLADMFYRRPRRQETIQNLRDIVGNLTGVDYPPEAEGKSQP